MTSAPKQAVGYCRCSTDKQDESISIQKQEIEKYAKANGYEVNRWYVDDGIDGHDESRPGFCQLQKDAEGSTWAFAIVRNQSRFGRFRAATMARYLDELDRSGVRLVTTGKGVIDVENLGDFIVSNVEAAGDNKYSRDLSSNTIRGQVEKARKGCSVGQLAPYGYDRMYVDEDGAQRQRVKNGEKYAKPKTWRVVFVPSDDPAEVENVQFIFESYVGGKGYRLIAIALNNRGVKSPKGGSWHQGTIRSMLKNPIYCGDFRWNRTRQGKFNSHRDGETKARSKDETAPAKRGRRKHRVYLNNESDWIVTVDAHEGIVSRKLWNQAQEIMEKSTVVKNAGRPPIEDNRYLLRGLCYCSDCGSKMHGTKTKKKKKSGKTYAWYRYVCSGYACKGICHHNAAIADELHEVVVQEVINALRSPRSIEAIRASMDRQSQVDAPDNEAKIDRIRTKLADVTKKLDKQVEILFEVDEDLRVEVSKRASELKQQQKQLAKDLEAAKSVVSAKAPQWTADDVVDLMGRVATSLSKCPPEKLQEALQQLVERIELDFAPVPWGKKTVQRLAGGTIHLRKVVGTGMAGTGSYQFTRLPQLSDALREFVVALSA